jgi:hypothetical protein
VSHVAQILTANGLGDTEVITPSSGRESAVLDAEDLETLILSVRRKFAAELSHVLLDQRDKRRGFDNLHVGIRIGLEDAACLVRTGGGIR